MSDVTFTSGYLMNAILIYGLFTEYLVTVAVLFL